MWKKIYIFLISISDPFSYDILSPPIMLQVPSMAHVTSTPKQPPATSAASSQVRENGADVEAKSKELEEARKALKELKAEFDAYKKDRAENER